MSERDESQDRLPPIVMGVPGPWRERADLAERVKTCGGGRFELAVDSEADEIAILGDRELLKTCGLEFGPRVETLGPLVKGMGQGRFGRRALRALTEHRSVAVLYGEGGSVAGAVTMMRFARVLLDAGGFGVVIESTGVAHSPEDFRKLESDPEGETPGGPFWAYTIVTPGKLRRGFYTCGMHNLGLRDAICEAFDDPHMAAGIMMNFLGYAYQAQPELLDGDVVGHEGVAMFRVYHEPCTLHDKADPFYNPYGMWRIRLLDERSAKGLKVRHPLIRRLDGGAGES